MSDSLQQQPPNGSLETPPYLATATWSRELLESWRRRHIAERRKPLLRFLIWQTTVRCNLRCRHCAATKEGGKELSTTQVRRIFDDIAEDMDPSAIRLGLTGGEPLVRKDLPTLIRHMSQLGFADIGIASNGLAIGQKPERLDALVEHGLAALNISLDGDETYHNWLRRHPRSYSNAVAAIRYARQQHPTLHTALTVTVSPMNNSSFRAVVDLSQDLGVPLVKIVAVMPYRRAATDNALLLDGRRFVELLQMVASHRQAFAKGKTPVQVTMTDDGFLGAFEGLVRDGLFNSAIGVSVATIWHDGRLAGCPQIPQDFNFQGDLLQDRFSRLWKQAFKPFRNRSWLLRNECRSCPDWRYCMGGSLHDRGPRGELLRCNALRIRHAWLEAASRRA